MNLAFLHVRRHLVVRSIVGFLTCSLRKWKPRPACGAAVKSVRISIVCVCVDSGGACSMNSLNLSAQVGFTAC